MTIDYHKDFLKSFKKLPIKIKKKFQERQLLFEKDQFNPILNNHALSGEYKGYRSVNVSGDIRAIFRKNSEEVLFIAIGSHSKLYGWSLTSFPPGRWEHEFNPIASSEKLCYIRKEKNE